MTEITNVVQQDPDSFYRVPMRLQWWQFIWDGKEKLFLRRSAGSWFKILLFYFVFYVTLLMTSLLYWQVFELTLYENRPKWTSEKSLLHTPGLTVIGGGDFGHNFHYDSENLNEVRIISLMLEDARKAYCEGRTCHEAAFENCTKSYSFGLQEGNLCLFVKINRVFGWTPDCYGQNDTLPGDMPDDVKVQINETVNPRVWLHCHPAKEEQKKLVIISYSPTNGYSPSLFPYENSPNATNPIVAVTFSSFKPNTSILIECRVWSKNIEYSRSDRYPKGSVRFTLRKGPGAKYDGKYALCF